MPAVARIGDTSSHGGEIISGSANVRANGIGVARVGDILACPIHGLRELVEGSPNVLANGAGVVRVGDHAECGAEIIEGSPNVNANG